MAKNRAYKGKGDSLETALDAAQERMKKFKTVDPKALPNSYQVEINGVTGGKFDAADAAYESALEKAGIEDPSGLEVSVRAFYDTNNPVFPAERNPQAVRPAGSYASKSARPLYDF